MSCFVCNKDRGYQRLGVRKVKCLSCGQKGKVSGRKGTQLTEQQKLNISEANLIWRRKQNPNYKPDTSVTRKIKHSLRTRLNHAIKGVVKTGSAVRDLGCSIEELKRHLESQFAEGMNWDNYGLKGWHIDHIKPLDAFELEDPEELKKACHFSNLQPLWAKDNLKKGAKYEV